MTELFRWEWVLDHRAEIWARLIEHVTLTAIAVGVGFLISFPIGVAAFRRRSVHRTATAAAGILYTIPSLALFAFLVPFTGLTVLTAQIGLVSYTLLILIRNVAAGLDAVPDDAKEAARGMGYGPWQLLWRVELPLAMPVIIAGIRIATVTIIGLVTVAALIGYGGFGYFILQIGLRRLFPTAIVLGSVLSIALAVLADVLLLRIERILTPWTRRAA